MDSPQRPDAVLIPDGWKSGDNSFSRSHSLLGHAEKLLAVDKSRKEQAHARPHQGGAWFCTRDPAATLLFPTAHERSGVPRYRWDRQPDGSDHGFLVDEAREVQVASVSGVAPFGGGL